MSKIGKTPIQYDPSKVKVTVEKGGRFHYKVVKIEGPQGEVDLDLRSGVEVVIESDELIVNRKTDSLKHKALHGLYRSLLNNAVIGVTEGFEKKLEIHGVGYRGEKQGNKLDLKVGYSHSVGYSIPDDVSVEMPDNNTIVVKGILKERVGEVAAQIRSLKKPEPYKGKGIRYAGEQIKRKAGKAGIS